MIRAVTKSLISIFGCGTCPCYKSSVSTRLINTLIFFITLLLCLLIKFGVFDVKNWLYFCHSDKSSKACTKVPEFLAIYRICFAVGLFFCAMKCITYSVDSSRDIRGGLQNGCWFYKLAVIVLMVVGCLCIPPGFFDEFVWGLAMVVQLGFSILELFIMIQFSHVLITMFIIGWVQGSVPSLFFMMIFAFVSINSATVIGLFLIIFYEKCAINLFFVIFNLYVCHFLIITTLFRDFGYQVVGVLQSGVMSIHVMLATWSAVASNPSESCNPNSTSNERAFHVVNYFGLFEALITILLVSHHYLVYDEDNATNFQIVYEERGFCGSRKVVRIEEEEEQRPRPRPQQQPQPHSTAGAEEREIQYRTTDENDDEYHLIQYHWSIEHLTYCLGLLYIMLTLTLWYTPSLSYDVLYRSTLAMWSKIIATWLCFFLYILLLSIKVTTVVS